MPGSGPPIDPERCVIHPEYTGKHRPLGFPCARCWLIWITAESDRYRLAEAAIEPRQANIP